MSPPPSSSKTNSLQTLMHLLNGYIGTGILVMPKAFSNAGLIVAAIGTPIIGLITNLCIHMLVDINVHLCTELAIPPIGDYAELAEKTFSVGPKWTHRFARSAHTFVTTFLLFTQLGGNCVYNLFIADNLKSFFQGLFEDKDSVGYKIGQASEEWYLLVMWPVLILINFIKSIKTLSYASTGANLFYLAAMGILFYNLCKPPLESISSDRADLQYVGSEFAQYFVMTVFTFEGITVAMPLYQSMKAPRNFGKMFGVVNVAIGVVICLYFAVGFLGYLKYGDDVAASITVSLPAEPLYLTVRLMVAFAVALTYPIILYVPIDMLWPRIKAVLERRKTNKFTINISNYLFRALLVTITFALAAAIPKLGLIIALVGSISSSSIAIIIPSILHTIAFWNYKKTSSQRFWLCIRNGITFIIGCLGLVAGTYFSIVDIVHELGSGDAYE